jgi:integrase
MKSAQQLPTTRVNTFLDSIERGSHNTKKFYNTCINHFAQFLRVKHNHTPDTIISPLMRGRINTYELLDTFVSYLTKQGIKAPALKVYIAAIKSYLQYNDVDIIPYKYRRMVKVPRFYTDAEEPLLLSDIRTLLEYNHNDRLRAYILLLVSSGMRAMEACSLRMQDMDFNTNPTTIHIRSNKSKTKRGRTIYCSNEATKHIHKFIEMHPNKEPTDLIFAIQKRTKSAMSLYTKLLHQFQKLEHIAEKGTRKENSHRHTYTFHSFRRTAFSIINEQTNSEYAHYFLGHSHSVYFTHPEKECREIYKTKCMPFLTIYQETRDNTIEDALKQKDRTINLLTRRMADIEHNQKIMQNLLRDPELLRKKLHHQQSRKVTSSTTFRQ